MSATRRFAFTVLALAMISAAVAWALVQRHALDGQQSIEQARADAVARTLDVVPDLLSYDPATLDADLANAQKELTARFRPQFEELQKELIEPTVGKEKILTTATVQRVGVTSATANKVKLVVFLEQTTNKAGVQAAPINTRAVLSLARIDGTWLVDDLKPV